MSTHEPHSVTRFDDLDEIARRLRALTRRYEDFFKLQFERLGLHMKHQRELIARADVIRNMMDDLQKQKQLWESDRETELSRISEASEKLMAAWTELENQQRKQLKDTSTGQVSESDGTFENRDALYPPPPFAEPGILESPSLEKTPVADSFGSLVSDTKTPEAHPSPWEEPPAHLVARPAQREPVPLTNPVPPVTPVSGDDSEKGDAAMEPAPAINEFEYEQLKRQMRQHANRQK